MKRTIVRIARMTLYASPLENPFEPPGEAAAGAVVTSAKWVSKTPPVTRRAARLRDGAKVRVTRIRIRRPGAKAEPAQGTEGETGTQGA